MRQVYVAHDPFDAHFVKDFLLSAGIEAVVRGEHLFALRGGVPMTADTLPTVWLVDDEDEARARDLIEKLQARARLRSVDGPAPEGEVEESEDLLEEAEGDEGRESRGS